MARRSNDVPRNLRSCLGWPIRLEPPAARMTAASTQVVPTFLGHGGGDRPGALRSRGKFAALGRDDLGQDGYADLLRRLRANVQADRSMQARQPLLANSGGRQPFAALALRLGTADGTDEARVTLQRPE